MNSKISFASLSILTALLGACKKDNIDPDGLVRATQTGKNTGDFLIDGKAFNPLPRVSSPATKPVGAYWYHRRKGDSDIEIFFFREDRDANSTVRNLSLFIANIGKANTYPLADLVSPFVVAGTQSFASYSVPGVYPASKKYYMTGPTSPGQVVITRFDTVAHVVSGTFEAQVREYNGAETLTLTKGRFDCSF